MDIISTIQRRLCRHTRVRVSRAHPKSSFGRDNQGKQAWTDYYGVNNYVVCEKCGTVLHCMRTSEQFYGQCREQ